MAFRSPAAEPLDLTVHEQRTVGAFTPLDPATAAHMIVRTIQNLIMGAWRPFSIPKPQVVILRAASTRTALQSTTDSL